MARWFVVPLAALFVACDDPGSDPEQADVERQLKVYCDGASCITLQVAAGYTAVNLGTSVLIKSGPTILMKYDIDGSVMPAGPWVVDTYDVVDCYDQVVGKFAIGAGLAVDVVDDFEFVVVNGAGVPIVSATSSDELHPKDPPA